MTSEMVDGVAIRWHQGFPSVFRRVGAWLVMSAGPTGIARRAGACRRAATRSENPTPPGLRRPASSASPTGIARRVGACRRAATRPENPTPPGLQRPASSAVTRLETTTRPVPVGPDRSPPDETACAAGATPDDTEVVPPAPSADDTEVVPPAPSADDTEVVPPATFKAEARLAPPVVARLFWPELIKGSRATKIRPERFAADPTFPRRRGPSGSLDHVPSVPSGSGRALVLKRRAARIRPPPRFVV